jgi:serine/threonine-protein kinase
MIGKSLLHYKILEKLGQGGMGVVYKAEDTRLKREVAIKFLPWHIASDEDARRRFEIEAQAAAALNHPNIAMVYAIEEVDDQMFIVMEYIRGQELNDLVKAGSLEAGDVTNIVIQIAEGLSAAHEKGIVHRDIKSSNIMMTDEGRIKIMDFGLAKLQDGTNVTKMGQTLGTAAYMSPEQAQGEEIEQRSDLWSCGVIFYELLTGELPFKGVYEQAVFYSIINEPPAPIPQHIIENVPHLEHIVYRCLEKSPQNRYQNASELLQDLKLPKEETASVSQISTSKKEAVQSPARQTGRRRTLLFAGAAFLALILVLLAISGGNPLKTWLKFSTVPDEQHLLVLPFTNVGGDSQKQAFCDGLVETMTSKLTQLEQFHGSLWVVPASEVRRNNIQSPGEAYKTFGANLVVSGSLQTLANMFRLTLNLIQAEDLRQLNSSVIDIEAENIAALQDQTVGKLFQMLNLQMNPKARGVIQAGGTTVSSAYEFYLQGIGYLQRYQAVENLDAAIEAFTQATAEDSLYALAHAGLGEAYWRKYEALKDNHWVDEAIRECQQAYRLNNQLPEVNVALGMINSGIGRYEEAVRDFHRALNSDPTNAAAYRGLAKAYEAREMSGEAEATYKRAIDLKPDYWAGYNDLGVFYFRLGRYEDAITRFRRVTELAPDNDRGYNNLGGTYYMLKRWPEAQEMFERSLSIRKTYRVCLNLGTLYFIRGQYRRATQMCEMALELNDNDYRVWGNLAAAYHWSREEKDKVEKTYRRAIELAEEQKKVNPQDAEVISDLANYYSMIGESDKSLWHIEQALALAPNNGQIIYRVSTAYEQMGNREKALFWIEKALKNGYSLSEIENQPELRELLIDERFQQYLRENSNTSGEKE